jgi:hypothetical protein
MGNPRVGIGIVSKPITAQVRSAGTSTSGPVVPPALSNSANTRSSDTGFSSAAARPQSHLITGQSQNSSHVVARGEIHETASMAGDVIGNLRNRFPSASDITTEINRLRDEVSNLTGTSDGVSSKTEIAQLDKEIGQLRLFGDLVNAESALQVRSESNPTDKEARRLQGDIADLERKIMAGGISNSTPTSSSESGSQYTWPPISGVSLSTEGPASDRPGTLTLSLASGPTRAGLARLSPSGNLEIQAPGSKELLPADPSAKTALQTAVRVYVEQSRNPTIAMFRKSGVRVEPDKPFVEQAELQALAKSQLDEEVKLFGPGRNTTVLGRVSMWQEESQRWDKALRSFLTS